MWSNVERVEWASLSEVCEEDVLGLCKWVDSSSAPYCSAAIIILPCSFSIVVEYGPP